MPDKIVKIKYLVEGLKDVQTAEKVWADQKKEVAAYNKTLAETRGSIQSVTQQMQLQKTAYGKLDEVQKTLRQGMQLELTALRELEQEQKAEQQAAREAAIQRIKAAQQAAIAVRDQKKEEERLRKEQEAAAKATGKSVSGWLKFARTLTFWGIGAASTYRLVQKLKAVLTDTVEGIFKNTEEYKKLQEAQDRLKGSIVAMLGTKEDWLKFFEDVTEKIDDVSEALLKLSAEIARSNAVIDELVEREIVPEGPSWMEVAEGLSVLEEQGEITEVLEKGQEAYNNRLEEGRKLAEEYVASQRDMKKEEEAREEMLRRQIKVLERLIDAEKRRIEATLDLLEELRQKEQDLATERSRAYEDMAIDRARSLEDIEVKYQRALEDVREEAANNRAKAEERLRLKLLQIELRYREQLIRIEEDFQGAIYDAIRTRDATAALQAIRRRSQEVGRAKRQRDDDRTIAQAEYQNQLREQERALEERRRDAEKDRRRALEDLRRDLERERQDIELNHQRELDDLNLFFGRRLDEINTDYERQMLEAQEFYTEDKAAYRDYLNDKLNELTRYYNDVVRVAAAIRAAQAGIGMPITATTGRGATGRAGSVFGYRPGLAEGGTFYFPSPTTINVAERHPEVIVAIPVSPGGASAGVGRLSANVSGRVEGVMPGFDGRFGAMVNEAVMSAFGRLVA